MNIQWTFGRLPHTSSEAELIAFMGAAPGNAEGFLRPNTFSMGGGLGRWLWETYGIPASRHQSHFARNMNAIRGARGQRRGDARTHDPGRPRRRRLEDGSRVLTGKRARAQAAGVEEEEEDKAEGADQEASHKPPRKPHP